MLEKRLFLENLALFWRTVLLEVRPFWRNASVGETRLYRRDVSALLAKRLFWRTALFVFFFVEGLCWRFACLLETPLLERTNSRRKPLLKLVVCRKTVSLEKTPTSEPTSLSEKRGQKTHLEQRIKPNFAVTFLSWRVSLIGRLIFEEL